MANLTPQNIDIALTGAATGSYADRLQHSGGGNKPMLIFRHGGAGTVGNRRELWTDGSPANNLAGFLNASATTNYDVVSLGTPQFLFGAGDGPPHLSGNTMEVPDDDVVYPECLDELRAAIEAVIALWTPTKVVLAGQSYGAIIMQALVMEGSLPTEVKGYFGYNPIPNLRKVPAPSGSPVQDVLSWKVIQGLYGATTKALWDAVPTADKEACSLSYGLENTLFNLPSFFAWARTGNHIKPYGDPVHPGASAHDSCQFPPMISAAIAAGLSHETLIMSYPVQWELDVAFAATANAAFEAWLQTLP